MHKVVERAAHEGRIAPGVVVAGRYRIVRPLAEGGIGSVWVAEHATLGRKMALKVLHGEVAKDARAVERFEREARTIGSLTHPNIVAPIDYGVWDGMPYLVMELLEGRPLSERLGVGKMLEVDEALAVMRPLLSALAYAHGRGIVHRDLKPANVFLEALPEHVDHVKLLDFGLAKPAAPHMDAGITGKGVAVGTPPYMPPEAATGATLDERADVYSVGVILFEMITGRRPFEGDAVDVIRRKMTGDALRARAARPDGTIPPWLDEAIAKALARRPDDRWPTAHALATALVPPKEPPRAVRDRNARTWRWAALMAAVVALALGLAWWSSS